MWRPLETPAATSAARAPAITETARSFRSATSLPIATATAASGRATATAMGVR